MGNGVSSSRSVQPILSDQLEPVDNIQDDLTISEEESQGVEGGRGGEDASVKLEDFDDDFDELDVGGGTGLDLVVEENDLNVVATTLEDMKTVGEEIVNKSEGKHENGDSTDNLDAADDMSVESINSPDANEGSADGDDEGQKQEGRGAAAGFLRTGDFLLEEASYDSRCGIPLQQHPFDSTSGSDLTNDGHNNLVVAMNVIGRESRLRRLPSVPSTIGPPIAEEMAVDLIAESETRIPEVETSPLVSPVAPGGRTRAALELHNLMLERQVEALKSQLGQLDNSYNAGVAAPDSGRTQGGRDRVRKWTGALARVNSRFVAGARLSNSPPPPTPRRMAREEDTAPPPPEKALSPQPSDPSFSKGLPKKARVVTVASALPHLTAAVVDDVMEISPRDKHYGHHHVPHISSSPKTSGRRRPQGRHYHVAPNKDPALCPPPPSEPDAGGDERSEVDVEGSSESLTGKVAGTKHSRRGSIRRRGEVVPLPQCLSSTSSSHALQDRNERNHRSGSGISVGAVHPTNTVIPVKHVDRAGAGGGLSSSEVDDMDVKQVYGESEDGETGFKEDRWSATLSSRWAEVEFLLRHSVCSDADLTYAAAAAESGLIFMDRLATKAKQLGVRKGQLSRWLLPYDLETSVAEQRASTPGTVKVAMPDELAAQLSDRDVAYLVRGATGVRALVRVKIADDNDLNTARDALLTMATFFRRVSSEAARRGSGCTAFDILQERRQQSPAGVVQSSHSVTDQARLKNQSSGPSVRRRGAGERSTHVNRNSCSNGDAASNGSRRLESVYKEASSEKVRAGHGDNIHAVQQAADYEAVALKLGHLKTRRRMRVGVSASWAEVPGS